MERLIRPPVDASLPAVELEVPARGLPVALGGHDREARVAQRVERLEGAMHQQKLALDEARLHRAYARESVSPVPSPDPWPRSACRPRTPAREGRPGTPPSSSAPLSAVRAAELEPPANGSDPPP
jgi:hypothetical protein